MEKFRATVAFIGRSMITVGLLMLLFVAYQLWGTNLWEANAQKGLKSELTKKLDNRRGKTLELPEIKRTPEGGALGLIEIPKINVDRVLVSGTATGDLKRGPGHYLDTPLPGEYGNMAIAGHRTTYGAPFANLDALAVGDEIIITTAEGEFTYKVSQAPFPVAPTQVEVIDPTIGDDGKALPTLTLTTCHPRFSARQRLIIKADLVLDAGQKLVDPPKDLKNKEKKLLDEEEGSFFDGIARNQAGLTLWGLFLLMVGAGWWILFHRYHSIVSWFGGVIVFLPVLFVFYIYLEKALPSNY